MTTDHPDLLQAQQQAKAITRGSRQAADTAAMNAMWDAIEAGKSREEYEKVFNETYKNHLSHERRRSQEDSNR